MGCGANRRLIVTVCAEVARQRSSCVDEKRCALGRQEPQHPLAAEAGSRLIVRLAGANDYPLRVSLGGAVPIDGCSANRRLVVTVLHVPSSLDSCTRVLTRSIVPSAAKTRSILLPPKQVLDL